MPTAHEVILVRHGESLANISGRFAYQIWDPPLSPKGNAQAQALSRWLARLPITYLATSPLKRAKDTIKPLADEMGLEPYILPQLVEVNLGQWDGAVLDQLRLSDADRFRDWMQDPETSPPPGGESILTVGRRVLSGLDQFLADRPSGLTVATTHADCLKGTLLVVLDAPGHAARRVLSPNTAMLHLTRSQSGRWSLLLGAP